MMDNKIGFRDRVLRQLDKALILFELILSVIFMLVSHLINSMYFKGVGIGLIIAWVTSALAYLYKHLKEKEGKSIPPK